MIVNAKLIAIVIQEAARAYDYAQKGLGDPHLGTSVINVFANEHNISSALLIRDVDLLQQVVNKTANAIGVHFSIFKKNEGRGFALTFRATRYGNIDLPEELMDVMNV